MLFKVTIIECKNFEKGLEELDAYCIINCGEQKFQTKIIKKSNNPIWNETFSFKTLDSTEQINFSGNFFNKKKKKYMNGTC
jgi:Ca2+-dependent lipid-binding protein